MVGCPDLGKEFTRKFNMECHWVIDHPDAISGETNSSVTDEPSDRSDHDTGASD